MPFINTKVSTKISAAQEKELKTKLGEAIELIPGKSEKWLMLGFEPEYKLYFRGENSEPMAYVSVDIMGDDDPKAYAKLTTEICTIFNKVLGIKSEYVYVEYRSTKHWGWNNINF